MDAPIDDRRCQGREDAATRRGAPRRRVLLAAAVETPNGERAVKLRNLSSTGALLELDNPPAAGTKIVFKRSSTRAPGTVVWAAGAQLGMHFDCPISESEVLIQIGRRS